MKIHEYQAKQIFRELGIPVPEGKVAETPDQAVEIARSLGTYPVAVKAQVHVGGRGKAGGVKLAKSAEEAGQHARAILGMSIKGITVKRVLVEAGVDIQREIYAGVIVDRERKAPVLILSAAGGVDIEEVAAADPEKILHLVLQPGLGLQAFQVRRACYFLELPKEAHRAMGETLHALERALFELDASLVEINPLVLTSRNEIIAADGKINLDDNALPLHPDLEGLRDENEEEPLEAEARRHALSYVKLDGKIGCLVNGAGLAMGTMDLVKHFGGEPANFLDVGGGASPERIAEALRIVTSDASVNTILFNIFGGIVRCDRVAEGVLKARELTGIDVPIVMRLVGTNEDKARELLEGTDLIMLPTMAEAAQKAVELSHRSGD
ncbi:MAG TPA: ADP-forming succinate--CoA ligase subunit beta [Candidatus Sumerlaeota bacterium]|nr:ADP-forming succinate--CoA ligase subunit beta [Candidatus Sumerlaeota bacterium]HPK04234.1 ADP-forming succinate--CoA ligase subunit beta [Candidatus Sumerlaeota bacterium]